MAQKSLTFGAAVTTVALVVRALLQAALFVMLARLLGPEGYGEFSAVLGVAALSAGLSGLGIAGVMVREVARSADEFGPWFSHALRTILWTSAPLLAAHAILASWLLEDRTALSTIVLVGAADLLLGPLCDLCARGCQALERVTWMALLFVLPVAARLLACAFLVLAVPETVTPRVWAAGYCGAGALAALLGLVVMAAAQGGRRARKLPISAGLGTGAYYALANSAARAHAEIDKPMLARFLGVEMAGHFSAAYRVLDFLMLPVLAALEVGAARFFRTGAGGPSGPLRLARSLVPVALVYVVIGAVVLSALAEQIVTLLGARYSGSIAMLRWLVWLAPAAVVRQFLTICAATSGHHRLGGGALLLGACLNIAGNLAWIPAYGWTGAFFATLAAECLMTLVLLTALLRAGAAEPSASRAVG